MSTEIPRCGLVRRPTIDELAVDDDGNSLRGRCSYCQRSVDNHDELHRVTAIMRGGWGVECVLRGDIEPTQAQPLGSPRG